jgi:uncharacterized protein YfkK (UPF0435 family)
MTNKTQGIVSIIAAIVVLFTAILESKVSIIIAVVVLVGMGVWQMMGKKNNLSVPAGHLPSLGEKGNVINPEQIKQRQEHLDKVMEMAKEKNQITNDEVQRVLGVSDATAERYLQELEVLGKLVQVGEKGRQVFYHLP